MWRQKTLPTPPWGSFQLSKSPDLKDRPFTENELTADRGEFRAFFGGNSETVSAETFQDVRNGHVTSAGVDKLVS